MHACSWKFRMTGHQAVKSSLFGVSLERGDYAQTRLPNNDPQRILNERLFSFGKLFSVNFRLW